MNVSVIIPVLNEEQSIGKVIAAIPRELSADIIVVDNGSTDTTAGVAAAAGARVVAEPEKGYGSACLRGMAELHNPDIVVFLDGDYSDYPEEMPLLIDPIASDKADFVIGSRILGKRTKDALPRVSVFGNRVISWTVRVLYGYHSTDLGPFRAIRYQSLCDLHMRDRTWGWTIEMQIKAAKHKLRMIEVPVSYRKRIGQAKITGTFWGAIKAGVKIFWTIFKYAVST
jgi:glycosyltransferase involved in cell wall biosynthesis